MNEKLDDVPFAHLAEDLTAISSEPRLRLLHALTRPRYSEEIAEIMGITRQGAAKHVERLLERGFVRALHGRRARGPVLEYQVVPQRIFALSVGLNELARLEPVGGPLVSGVDPTIKADAGGALPETPASPVPQTAHLVLLDSATAGTRIPLQPDVDRWTIGREEDRDVRPVHDPYVSGRHAEVRRSAAGFDVIDQFSANGTFLNFVKLPKGARVPLHSGDIVTVGRTALVLQCP